MITDKGEPMILNAFTDIEKEWPHSGPAEWCIMIGWCCGTMTALPLLKFGGKYREFALKFIGFLTTHGDSLSGVKYSVYDGNAWMTPEHPEFRPGYNHCRFYSDYLYYLGKAIRFEKEKYGVNHPAWEADYEKGLGILPDLWEREQDFGMYWNVEGEKVTLQRAGTCAGAFSLLALAEGCRQFPENTRLARCFQEACRSYHGKYVLTGRSFAGPVDIWQADDSESIAALTDALVQQYQLFGGEENLQRALDAAKLFATSGGFSYDECSLGRGLAVDASYILPAAAWIRDLHPLELTRTGHCKKPPTHIGIGGFCEWLRFGYRLKSFLLSHDLPKG